MSEETREVVFRDNIHVLNWLECSASYARPSQYMHRMFRLEQRLRQTINRIALYTPPQDLDDLLQPLQIHYNASWSPVQRLEELRIILDVPRITSTGARRWRISAENQVSRTAYHLRHVDKVVIQNLFYRDQNQFGARAPGREWSVLAYEDDDDRLNDDRFQLVFTTFAP